MKTVRTLTTAELLKVSTLTANRVQRDASDFEDFGYELTILDELQALRKKLANIPDDDFTIVAQNKVHNRYKQTRKTLDGTTRMVLYRIVDRFGSTNEAYAAFKLQNIPRYSIANFTAKVTHLLNAINTTKFEGHELPDNLLKKLNRQVAEANKLHNLYEEKASARRAQTKKRQTTHKLLYALVMRLNNAGKFIYKYSDPAKYKDYVVYGSTHKTESPSTYVAA